MHTLIAFVAAIITHGLFLWVVWIIFVLFIVWSILDNVAKKECLRDAAKEAEQEREWKEEYWYDE